MDEHASRAAERPMCEPISGLLELLSRAWTMQIIWVLCNQGGTRFGVLRRAIPGVSARVLTERLRMLEDRHLVDRDYEATIPPKVTYRPTPRLLELGPAMAIIAQLAYQWEQEDSSGDAVRLIAPQSAGPTFTPTP